MSKTLGLDLGTNSIGWCLIEDDKKIISTGVRILPVGVKEDDYAKSGTEISKNVDRRTLRGARRRNRLKIRQTCIAPDYVIVDEKRKDKFIAQLSNTFTKMMDSEKENLVRIISTKHFERIQSITKESLKQGAKCVYGGGFNKKEKRIEPTILTEVTPENQL